MSRWFLKLLGLSCFLLCSTAVNSAPRVLVSVSPLYGVVADLMKGAGKPALLLDDGIDLHHFSYKPSDISKLNTTQLLVWVGEGFEPDLATYVESDIVIGKSIELAQALPKQMLLQMSRHHDEEATTDPHLWLSPATMNKAIHLVAESLIKLDPENANIYQLNLEIVSNKLKDLSVDLKNKLTQYHGKSFAVYHNAYAYLVRDSGLQQPLVLESSVHGQLSLNRLRSLVQKAPQKPNCVVISDLDPVKKIKHVMDSLDMKVVELSSIGKEDYYNAMQQLTDELVRCFAH